MEFISGVPQGHLIHEFSAWKVLRRDIKYMNSRDNCTKGILYTYMAYTFWETMGTDNFSLHRHAGNVSTELSHILIAM